METVERTNQTVKEGTLHGNELFTARAVVKQD